MSMESTEMIRDVQEMWMDTSNVSKEDIRKLMERASRDEHSYICLPEHVSSFTQTKLEDIRKLMERASRDEHSYICLPEHVSSFTQTKLVPEIYTKDKINEMFYRFYGAQEKNEGDEARHSQNSACG
ncbi:hypothetical protein F2Q69_00005833 [Brassica cretica]|uniref:Uncharacterized protein n=1 Tax=Brassica cretica TaxID=69181 RepID=A0A8S9NZP3_BRACR|nr:hypothetical protein F2Q69_00005833 [Brassica cretica]